MKCKGLTRVEVIVVIVSVTLLIGTLLMAPVVLKGGIFRRGCANNLAALGRAMQLYCADYNGKYPRIGGPDTIWARYIKDWDANDISDAYTRKPDDSVDYASISSCLYLLVKYYDVEPESFICGGDSGVKVFEPAGYGVGDRDLATLWDFGREPELHISYSYHTPFNEYALATSSDPGMAVLADRNPWITSMAAERRTTFVDFNPIGRRKDKKLGNSMSHKEEGQNVLFIDGHVGFEDVSFCGVNGDNIYTFWNVWSIGSADILKGIFPSPCRTDTKPQDKTDSLLVQDGNPLTIIKIKGLSPEDIENFYRQTQELFQNNR